MYKGAAGTVKPFVSGTCGNLCDLRSLG